MLRKLGEESLTYLLGRLLPGLAGLVSVVLLMRLLGASQYGDYALMLSFASLMSALAGGWFYQAILRFRGPGPGGLPADAFLAQPRHLALCAGLVLAAVPVLSLATRQAQGRAWWLVGVSALLALGMIAYYAWLSRQQAALQPRRVLLADALRGVLTVALPATAAALGASAFVVILATALAFVFTVPLLNAWQARFQRLHRSLGEAEATDELQRDFRFGAPLSLWLGLSMVFPVIDRLVIAQSFDTAEVGRYASLYDLIIRGLALAFTPVVMAAHPRIMQLADSGDDLGWRRFLRLALLVQTALFVPLLLLMALAAEAALPLLLGAGQYSPGQAGLVWPLAIAGFLWQCALLVHKPLEVRRRTLPMLIGIALSLLLHLVLCLLWVPAHGAAGAAYAYLVAALAYIGLTLLANRLGGRGPTC